MSVKKKKMSFKLILFLPCNIFLSKEYIDRSEEIISIIGSDSRKLKGDN